MKHNKGMLFSSIIMLLYSLPFLGFLLLFLLNLGYRNIADSAYYILYGHFQYPYYGQLNSAGYLHYSFLRVITFAPLLLVGTGALGLKKWPGSAALWAQVVLGALTFLPGISFWVIFSDEFFYGYSFIIYAIGGLMLVPPFIYTLFAAKALCRSRKIPPKNPPETT